jgi:hypothetical protein
MLCAACLDRLARTLRRDEFPPMDWSSLKPAVTVISGDAYCWEHLALFLERQEVFL